MSSAITQITTLEPQLSTSGGTSDGRFIADICSQVVEFGPRNATIHKLNEHVAVDDIEQLSQIYQLTLENLLAVKIEAIPASSDSFMDKLKKYFSFG
jgi:succinyl-diaminopimelate desuccinylase